MRLTAAPTPPPAPALTSSPSSDFALSPGSSPPRLMRRVRKTARWPEMRAYAAHANSSNSSSSSAMEAPRKVEATERLAAGIVRGNAPSARPTPPAPPAPLATRRTVTEIHEAPKVGVSSGEVSTGEAPRGEAPRGGAAAVGEAGGDVGARADGACKIDRVECSQAASTATTSPALARVVNSTRALRPRDGSWSRLALRLLA